MRLHHLTLSAFGPFAGREDIDFDALGAAGLFLFTGPTGAGKTSVLDAVAFALYGQVPGARQGFGLRSHGAAADVPTEVTLELTIRGRRLRVTRSPSWERPKRRGSGTTTEPAKILVTEHSPAGWRAVSTRLDEAGQFLTALIGLSMAQFCQVVLLPQNQFAEFLRADADRRRELLESLFDTSRFADVEGELVDARREATRLLEATDEKLGQVLARVAEVGDVQTAPESSGADAAAAWVAQLRAASAARALAATDAEAVARRERAAAASTFAAAEQLVVAQRRYHALTKRRSELVAESPAVSTIVLELEAARRAAPVVPLLSATTRLQHSLADAVGQVASATQTVSRYHDEVEPESVAEAAGLRRRAAQVRAELGSLHRLVDDEARADQLARELDDLERQLVALESRSTELAKWLAAAPAAQKMFEEALATAQRGKDQVAGLADGCRAAQKRLAARRRHRDLAGHQARQADELRSVTDAAQQARQVALDLREARLRGMAAELARELVDGVACTVCGSEQHPDPARRADGAVTRRDEALAEQAAQAEESTRVRLQAQLAETEVELAEARAVAGEGSLAELMAAVARAQGEQRAAEAAAAAYDEAERELHRFRLEQERQIQQRMALDGEAHRLRERTTIVRGRLVELHNELASARGGHRTVRDRAERLTRLAADCDALTDALLEAERLRVELDEAQARAAAAAAASGLDLALVVNHIRDDRQLAELEEHRARHLAELTSVEQLLADPVLDAAGRQPAPDVALAQADAERAEAEHQRAVEAKHAAQRCAASLARLSRDVAALLDERAPLAAHHATVDALSRLVEGKSSDNRLRMSLSGYVLAARLERVAAAASARLVGMSSGRYTLMHSDVAEGRRGTRGGLHLRVLDAWNGRERDPATLSGGESFSASLALALGLADVVTAEAGGSLLETLFVDEGFGSLDEDTLDEVMGMLDGLRDGGRVIGIVSHVADLRQRIPMQLEIVKSPEGSRVRHTGPGTDT